MGVIIWIIIIVWVVYAVSKGKKQSRNQGNSQSMRRMGDMQQKAQINRGQTPYRGQPVKQNSRSAEPDILARAKASVNEDFSVEGGQTPSGGKYTANMGQTPLGGKSAADMGQTPPGGKYAAGPRQSQIEAQRELKARLAKKYKSAARTDILQRAKASVAEDFTEDEIEESYGAAEVSGAENPVFPAAGGPMSNWPGGTMSDLSSGKQEGGASYQAADIAGSWENGSEEFMREIQDLMIKGPDTDIAFERDFVSEGLDLLNRIQV